MTQPAPIDLLLFDLDGTLYDRNNGYTQNVHDNIFKFLLESKGGKFDAIDSIEKAKQMWEPIFAKYNLTKRGLLAEGYEFDPAEYDSFVRQGADKFFAADPKLRSFLQSLPQQRKVIFTNAPEASGVEILELLGVADLFEHVYGTDFLENKVCKPEPEAFDKVLQHLGVSGNLANVCYFEDSFKNLVAGRDLGFRTVYIESSAPTDGDDCRVDDMKTFDAIIKDSVLDKSLREQFPQLWAHSEEHSS